MKKKLLLIIGAAFLTVSTFAQQKKVLIMGVHNTPEIARLVDVQTLINNTSRFSIVDTFNMKFRSPSLALLQTYDAVFVYTDGSPQNTTMVGDTLAAYVDAGGGVVDATFTGNVPIGGAYASFKLYSASSQTQGTVRTLGAITTANHPIMNNVSSFNGGTDSYHNITGTVGSGAYEVAQYDNTQPLVIAHNGVGLSLARRAFLNFYPPSDNTSSGFWDSSTDGDILMANALEWVAGVNVGVEETNSVNILTVYPNPTKNTLTINTTEQIQAISIIDVTGKTVESLINPNKTIDVSELTNGLYFLTVKTKNGVTYNRFIKE